MSLFALFVVVWVIINLYNYFNAKEGTTEKEIADREIGNTLLILSPLIVIGFLIFVFLVVVALS